MTLEILLAAALWAAAPITETPAPAVLPAPGEEWTLAAAARAAIDQHPSLAAARARRAEAAAAEAEVLASSRLAARWVSSLTYNREPMLVSPIHEFGPGFFPPLDETLIQSSINVGYTLWDGGAKRERLAQTRATGRALDAATSALEQALLLRVGSAYANVLARDAGVRAQAERQAALDQELGRARQFFAAGKAAELEILRGEAALAAAAADATRAQTALELAQRELARLVGVEPERMAAVHLAEPEGADFGMGRAYSPRTQDGAMANLGLTPQAGRGGAYSAGPDSGDRAALYEEARAASPELAQARLQVQAAEAGRRLARTAYYPELRAQGALQEFGSDDLDFQTEWYAGVTLTVPLWDSGVTRQRVLRAEASRQELEARVGQLELDADAAVDRALANQAEADARVAALDRAKDRLLEVVRVQKLLMDAGSGVQTDYLTAQADLALTRAAADDARAAGRIAGLELARALGRLHLAYFEKNAAAGCACAADDQGLEEENP